MIKWQPFATMPEQYERVAEMIEEQAKCPAPTHDNEILVRLEEELRRRAEEQRRLLCCATGMMDMKYRLNDVLSIWRIMQVC